MVKQRKQNPGSSSPSATSTPTEHGLEIGDKEQWRLIEQSGILKRASETYKLRPSVDPLHRDTSAEDDSEDELNPLLEELFSTVIVAMPLSFFLLLLHILVHIQYQQTPDVWYIAGRMASGVPFVFITVFYVNRHKSKTAMKLALLLVSFAAGARSIWVVNKSNWRVVMEQTPALGTVWVYTIVVLDLLPAVLALLSVSLYTWWSGLHIVFN